MGKNGGARPGAGRKPKVEEARIKDLVSPYLPDAVRIVSEIMVNGAKEADRIAAAKLLLSYGFGLPKQSVDHTTDGKALPPTITVLSAAAAKEIELLNSAGDG